jgi:hypothetical protein
MLQLAIREDHDPFALPGVSVPGVPGRFYTPLHLLCFLRWTSYACPHCHQSFHRDYWPANVRLGNGERTCDKCGKTFDDGSREWPELKLAQKIRFFLPPGIQAIGGALLFCAIFTLFIAPSNVVDFIAGVLVVSVFLSPILLWCGIRLLWVFPSKHRFESDPSSMRRRLDTGDSY